MKVQNGTRRDGPALCKSCRRSVIMASAENNREAVYCHSIEEYIHTKVTECNAYEDKATPSLYEMESIAWVLVTKKAGRDIGFRALSAKDYKKEFKTHTSLPERYS